MLTLLLATVGLLALAIAAGSRWLRETPVTPPLLALGLGVLLGPTVFGLAELRPGETHHVLNVAAELLLAVGLMAVALRFPAGRLRAHVRPLLWLLLVVLPLMAATVALVSVPLLGLGLGTAVALGAALAPTDPVLSSGVVTGPAAERDVPERLRQVLSFESGLNDGLALPLVAVGLAFALGHDVVAAGARGLLEVAVGAAVGLALGAAAGRLLRAAEKHGDVTDPARLLYTLVLALAVLGIADGLGGNGVLAVLVAGLAHNLLVSGGDRATEADLDEGMNTFLILPVFTLLGIALPVDGWRELGWGGVAFVAAVLFLRRLPWVFLVGGALGTGRGRPAVWLGWFGPIGVAALFYLTHLHERGLVDEVVWDAGSLAVVASTVFHSLTTPLGRRLLAGEAHADHGR
ncbi:cation:proton antiporter [Egicoccus sp. AB-alg2]|uniref:cation:proton antiporter domain-containing protein n=1 Tax=Egicoccus sp. AB-alg2 TaxID=3242693 RepID=UPI00359E924F